MKWVRWEHVKTFVAIGLVLLTIVGTMFVFWAKDISKPSWKAIHAFQTDEQVTVKQEDGLVTFEAAGGQSTTGLIFYPGSRVDYRAYGPLLRQIAARGYVVFLTPMPLNIAILRADAADQVIAKYPQVEHWAIGGHSLGGVAASSYAADHPVVEGLVLWASFPADAALKEIDIRVLSIYGSNDGLSPPARIDESRKLLPPDALFVEIEGGNHAQFGSYGPQAGDNNAAISPQAQWTQVVEATAAFLGSLSNQ